MVRVGCSFNLLDEDENKLVRVVDEKAEDLFMALVKEENKKIKAEEKKKKMMMMEEEKKKMEEEEKKKKMEEEEQKKQVEGQSQNGADSEANGGQNYGGVVGGYYYQRRNYREGNGDYQGRSRSRVEEEGKINNGGQNYGRVNGAYHFRRRNHGVDGESSGDYQGRSQSGIEEEGRINNGGQNYGRVNGGYYRQRQNYRVVNGGNQGNNQGQKKEEEVKANNGVDNGEGWEQQERRRRPDQGGYDQQRGDQGGFRDERQGPSRWRGNDFQGRRRNSETENNNGDNNGVGLEKEKEADVVVENQEQETGGMEEGKNGQLESNGVNGSSNKSSDKKFGPNINGSLRRKLKKKKEAEAEKNQGDNNGPAAIDGTAGADATVAVEKKFTVLFTLKEYEKKVLATKKEGVEVVSKGSDGDRERTETLVKEFESMQLVGKKKLVTGNNTSARKMPGQSAEVDKKKDGLNLKKARALKTQTVNINEFVNQQKDGGFEGHHHSRSAPARKPHASNGRMEGHHRSQTAPVEKPRASLKLDDGYEFPALGGKS